MNLNTDFKPATDSPKEPDTRPLYKDGLLHWYLDSKVDGLPREIIENMVNGIIHQYDLLDLNKMYHKLVRPNPNSIELPIRICYDPYSIMCSKYDEPEKQAALEKERELLSVSEVELKKLIRVIVKRLRNLTGFGFFVDRAFDDSVQLFIKPSKYAAFSVANSIIRHININEYGKDKVITVWLKDKDGEFYLPSFTVPEVEYEYLAPIYQYGQYSNENVQFTVKPGRRSFVNTFSTKYDVTSYLENIEYEGEYLISVSDISNADLSEHVLTNCYISRELIEPLRDDNSVKLFTKDLAKDTKFIIDCIDKMLGNKNEVKETTLSDYVDVFISLGVQSKIYPGLHKDAVFTDNTLFDNIKEKLNKIFGLRKDDYIFNRKGKPVNVDEILTNITEKEFFYEFKHGGFFTRRYKEEKRIHTITLNNDCVIHYKPNMLNYKDVFKCFAGKHINVKNIRPFNLDAKQEYVWQLINLREECYFVKVEKNESGLKIPSFKSCSEIFLTAEDCEKYLKEAFENGKDTSGIYFVKSHWSEGYHRDFYKDISTGKYYTEFSETNYVTPIPMDIKF